MEYKYMSYDVRALINQEINNRKLEVGQKAVDLLCERFGITEENVKKELDNFCSNYIKELVIKTPTELFKFFDKNYSGEFKKQIFKRELSEKEKSEHELKRIYCQLFINYFKGK